MPTGRYFIFLLMLLFLSSCAGGKIVSPDGEDALLPRAGKTLSSSEPVPAQRLRAAADVLQSGNGDAALKILRQVREDYPDTPWYKRALFLTERTLIRMDRPGEAEEAMLRAQAEYPELAEYALFLLAEYHYSKARHTEASTLYQRIIQRHPKSTLAARSAFRRAQALLGSYAYPQAAEAFEKFLKENPRSEFAPAAGLGLGQALTAEARLTEAVRAYRKVWVNYPGNSNDQNVEKALAAIEGGGVEVPDPGPEELYERGRNLFRSNQYEKALETFVMLLAQEPKSPYRPDVLLRNGIASFMIGRRSEAAVILERMVKDYPADYRLPEALNWIGKSYSKLGEWEKAVRAFRKILDRYPESDWADDALFLTGNIYRDTGDLKKALAYYGRLADHYPESKFADSAIWWKAWTNYTAGAYQKAEQALQELISRYPRSFLVNQARYWQGRAAEQEGELSRAVRYYERVLEKGPYTYYGYRAAERLAALEDSDTDTDSDSDPDRDADTVVLADFPADRTVLCKAGPCSGGPLSSPDADDGPPIWTEEARALLAAEPSFRKTLELMYVDMKKEAAAELSALQERTPRKRGALLGLSKAFFELGDYHHSLLLVLRNYERYLEAPLDGAPEDLWLLAYPQAYWESILSYARKYKQDPYFVAAVMREESQFNPEALSPAGARGLMQVMPSTGTQVAQQIKVRGFDGGKLYDADTGINIGTWYIGNLMKRFKEDPVLAAAAYNAGPEAVASWIKKNGYHADRDAFVESIPYMETRGYVKKVLRNYAEYRRIYGRTPEIAPLAPPLRGDMPGPMSMGEKAKTP